MRILLTIVVIILSFQNIVRAQDRPRQEGFDPERPGAAHPEAGRLPERAAWRLSADRETTDFGPLGAYDGYFDQAARFGFGFMRYQPRGYGARYRSFRLGGVEWWDWFGERPAWNAVGGLTAVGYGVYDPASEVPGSLGAGEDRQVVAWQQSRGGRVALSGANRSYNFRVRAGYGSGENDRNGWAYSLFAGWAWGRWSAVEGVRSDSWTLFGSVSRRFGGDRHRIGLTAWYVPSCRTLQAASTAEAFALTETNLYNPAWGPWNEERRSARGRESRQPVAMLTHEYRSPSELLRVTTTVAARFGVESRSNLDWWEADNPYPDHYRYLPSFYPDGSSEHDRLTVLWRTDPRVRQIDWAELVDRNRSAQSRAYYVLSSRVREYREARVQSEAEWRLSERTSFRGGVDLFWAENLNYKRLDDLLGGSYWLDVDVFAEDPEDVKNDTQNDMRYPNRQVTEGEAFGYRYSMQRVAPRLWSRFSTRYRAWDFEAAGTFGLAAYRRFGYYDKENFPGRESFGRSAWLQQPEWFVRGGAGYNIGSRFRVGFRFTAQRLAPAPQDAFISPEYRNALVPGLRGEDLLEAECRVDYRTPIFRGYLGAFAASIRNRTEVRSFYDDLNHYFCNYLMSGIDTRHLGLEFSAEVQLARQLALRAAGAWTDCRYTSNPEAVEVRESTGEVQSPERVYYRNLRTAAGPQAIGTLELEYTPSSWIFSVAVNGFAANYVAPTPLRRTERVLRRMPRSVALDQEDLGAGATVDLFLGRTFYVGSQRLGIYAGVDNLLNRRNIRTSGYESSRVRQNYWDDYVPLASKYYYAQGINFFVTASWRF